MCCISCHNGCGVRGWWSYEVHSSREAGTEDDRLSSPVPVPARPPAAKSLNPVRLSYYFWQINTLAWLLGLITGDERPRGQTNVTRGPGREGGAVAPDPLSLLTCVYWESSHSSQHCYLLNHTCKVHLVCLSLYPCNGLCLGVWVRWPGALGTWQSRGTMWRDWCSGLRWDKHKMLGAPAHCLVHDLEYIMITDLQVSSSLSSSRLIK